MADPLTPAASEAVLAPGWYWVRASGGPYPQHKWEIAKWTGTGWYFANNTNGQWHDDDLNEIDERPITRQPAAQADLAALRGLMTKADIRGELRISNGIMRDDATDLVPIAVFSYSRNEVAELMIALVNAYCDGTLRIASAAGDVRAFEAGAEQREAWTYLWRWVERGYFDMRTSPMDALDVMAFHPSAPWNNGEWDVTHTPYAEKFYAKFPKARPQRATTTEAGNG